MFSLIFTTLGQGKSVAKEFREAWSAVFDKANNDVIEFGDKFTKTLETNKGYIQSFKDAVDDTVDGGMSKVEATAKYLASASTEAKRYVEDTNIAEISTENFEKSQKSAEIATIAQTKSLTNLRTIINTYNAGADKLGLTTEEFNKSVKESNGSLGTYLSSLNGAKASMGGYIKSLVSAKLSTIALSVASAALNAAISFVISAVIAGISELVHREEKLIEKSEEAKSAIQSINDELKENSKTVKDTSERFATLAKKVDDLGKLTQNKGALSTEEYEEFLNLSNQLAGVFPELTKGYDDNGNAILDLSGDVNTIVSSLDDLIDRQKQLANQEIIDKIPDVYGGYAVNVKNITDDIEIANENLQELLEIQKIIQNNKNKVSFDIYEQSVGIKDERGEEIILDYQTFISKLQDLGIQFEEAVNFDGGDGGFYGNTEITVSQSFENIDILSSKIEDAQKEVKYQKSRLQSELSSFNQYINTWLQDEWIYKKFDDTGIQQALQQMLLSFDPSTLEKYGVDVNSWDAVSDWIRQNILRKISEIDDTEVSEAISKLFSVDNLSLKELEGLVETIKGYFGEDSPVYLFIKPKFDENGDGTIDAKKLADNVKKFIKDEFDNSVDELSLDDLAIAASDEFWKFLNVPDGTLLSVDKLNKKLKEYKEISDSSIEPLSFKDALSGVNALSSGLDELNKIYTDVYNKEDFDWNSILDNEAFELAFSKLDKLDNVYSDFIETVANSPSDIKSCQKAFDKLVTAYINQSEELDKVTEATRDATVAFLEQKGVANAAEIVDEKLASRAHQTAIEKEKERIETELGTDASYDAVVAKMNEVKATGDTEEAYAQLALDKLMVNKNQIKTSGDIAALDSLTEKANLSAASLLRVAEAKKLLAEADKYKDYFDSATDPRGKSAAMSQYTYYLNLAKEKLGDELEYNAPDNKVKFKGNVSGGSSGGSSGGGSGNSSQTKKTWFEKDLATHQHNLNMGKESEAKYYKWLTSAVEKAYKQNKITLDDYRKYQEDIYNYNQEKLKDSFQKQVNDHKHSIAMDKETEAEYYKWLSSQVNKAYKEGKITSDERKQYWEEIHAYRKKLKEEEEEALREGFAKEVAAHKHKVAMDKETEAEYYEWLASVVNQARKDGKITSDEREQYWEEIHAYRKKAKEEENEALKKKEEEKREALREGFAKEVATHKHKVAMDKETEAEYYKWLAATIKKAYNDGKITFEEYQQYWEEIHAYRKRIKEEAEDAIDNLVDYRIDMLKKDVENEKDALEKKLDNLKEFYDKQKEMLQDVADEEKYLDNQSEKRKKVTDIQVQLSQLEFDNSAWAEKRKAELKQELADAQKELNDFEKDHALDLALDALDDAYNSQESALKKELEGLDEILNNPHALFNQALQDIKNNSENQLYYQMLMYNRQYGDGKDTTIKEMWEDSTQALDNYYDIFDKNYKNIILDNSNTKSEKSSSSPSADKASSTADKAASTAEKAKTTADKAKSSTDKTKSSEKSTTSKSSESPKLTDAIKRKVAAAIWNGGFGWGENPEREKRLTEVFGKNNGIQALVSKGVGKTDSKPSKDYTYLNMRKKFKGYASGTRNATAGWHAIDELGDEYVFTSSDGTRYKMLNSGDHVLNANATDFLYNFANGGKEILGEIIRNTISGIADKITSSVNDNEFNMGNIIIQGDCKERTISEIRRAQRDEVNFILREFNKLNK